MTEFVGCSGNRGFDFRIKVGTAILKNCQQRFTQPLEGPGWTASRGSEPEWRKSQVFRSNYISPANQQRVMDDVFQFSRITWPGVSANQHIDRLRAQCGIRQPETFSINSEKVLR